MNLDLKLLFNNDIGGTHIVNLVTPSQKKRTMRHNYTLYEASYFKDVSCDLNKILSMIR